MRAERVKNFCLVHVHVGRDEGENGRRDVVRVEWKPGDWQEIRKYDGQR